MNKKQLINIIDRTIRDIWKNEIAFDYEDGWLLKEDTLKNAIYFHLRTKLGKLFENNDVRIFTEFTDDKFKGTGCRPDIVIAKVNFDSEEKYYGKWVKECLCIMELKYKGSYNAKQTILDDYEKLHRYFQDFNVNCKMYMATIWEHEEGKINYERKNSAWAKNRLTELNASYNKSNGEMSFTIYKH